MSDSEKWEINGHTLTKLKDIPIDTGWFYCAACEQKQTSAWFSYTECIKCEMSDLPCKQCSKCVLEESTDDWFFYDTEGLLCFCDCHEEE